MNDFAPAAVVGILSAAANVVEKQAKNRKTGTDPTTGQPIAGKPGALFGNASLWGDIAIGTYAVLNYTDMAGRGWYPTDQNGNGNARAVMAGAGMALLARRAADWAGATLLNLPTGGGRYTAIPGRSMQRGRPSLRSPGAAVETSVLPRKRQFFSVT
jgi:hypothetical protein